MPKQKISIDAILEKLSLGERLGIDEAQLFLAASEKWIGGNKALETFFDAARREASRHLSIRPLASTAIDMAVSDALKKIESAETPVVYLRFAPAASIEIITPLLQATSKLKTVAAFSPVELFALAEKSRLKILTLTQRLSEAGLLIVPDSFTAKASDESAIDETFSVMMQLHKYKLKTSAWLPMSYTDAEKAVHLAKIREFEDRTHSFLHLTLKLDAKFSDKQLLRTVALCRLMLDNFPTISLSDFNLDQSGFITPDLQRQCAELGLNQV